MRKIICLIIFVLALCFPEGVLAQQPIRVKCGGASYTDSKGQVWQSDAGYYAGPTSTYSTASPISGTADPKLFQSERYINGSAPMIYSFPVPNGSYHVNLLFAEIYDPLDVVGGRVCNVKIQGNLVFSKYSPTWTFLLRLEPTPHW